MSDYIRSLRAKIGNDVLEVPTASVILRDEHDRVLLVRHVEGDLWTTPGGMVEPYETPADAAVRETWEETGLYVRLTRIVGVFGGPHCCATYANGDRIAWVCTTFAAVREGGTLRPDGHEIVEARYVARAAIGGLRAQPHVARFVDAAFATAADARFDPPTWCPDSS
jgi:ADP-ribose pyrophosphatase YjhB (NUDIX family)